MKKTYIISLIIIITSLFSCERDESLDPRPLLIGGQFVRLDITKKRLNSDNIDNSTFGGLLTNPSGNVVKYNLYVRRRDPNAFLGEFALVKTVNSFPFELNIKAVDIATALNLPLTSLARGDVYQFYGESFDANSNRADYFNLSTVVQSTPSMKQGYRFHTDLANTVTITEATDFSNYDSPQ